MAGRRLTGERQFDVGANGGAVLPNISTPLGDMLSSLSPEDLMEIAALGVGGKALKSILEDDSVTRSERVQGPFPTRVKGPFPTRVLPEESTLAGINIAPGERSSRVQGPFPTRVIPEESFLEAQQPLPEMGQPLPTGEQEQFAPTQLPSSQRFFLTEEPGQAPKLSNVPTGSRYERELQLPEQRTMSVDGREVTISGDRPLDEGGRRMISQALAPPVDEAMPEERGTALEQAQDLFDQLQGAGVANEFQAAMKETGLDQQIKLEERIAKARPEAEGISEVQSSKILPGGAGAVVVRKDGSTELVTLKEAERLLIKEVEKHDAELQGLRAGEREAAKTAQVKSKQAFEKMTLAQENIISIDKAITELESGANTGVVMSLLPSFKASTIRLENIQKQLGLNVIGGVTFGALSKGELDLALSKALPTDLQPEDLSDWLIDYKTAQEKLITNLQDAAIFLGTPGNTVAKFLARNKEQAAGIAEAPTAEAGGVQEGATATNPTTGAKIIFRGGQWQTA